MLSYSSGLLSFCVRTLKWGWSRQPHRSSAQWPYISSARPDEKIKHLDDKIKPPIICRRRKLRCGTITGPFCPRKCQTTTSFDVVAALTELAEGDRERRDTLVAPWLRVSCELIAASFHLSLFSFTLCRKPFVALRFAACFARGLE